MKPHYRIIKEMQDYVFVNGGEVFLIVNVRGREVFVNAKTLNYLVNELRELGTRVVCSVHRNQWGHVSSPFYY